MANWSKQLLIKVFPEISTRQFVVAVSLLTIVGFVLTFIGIVCFSQPTGYWVILEIQMALAFNAIVPHLLSSLRFRLYSPGIVTALLINLPFSFYLFQRALSEKIIGWAQVWYLLALAPVVTVIAALTSLQAGKWLLKLYFTASGNMPDSSP